MDLFQNNLLRKYEELVKLSLVAQHRGDFEEDDRITELLDVLWMELSADEQQATEFTNRRLVSWFELQKTMEKPRVASTISGFFAVELPVRKVVGNWDDVVIRGVSSSRSRTLERAVA